MMRRGLAILCVVLTNIFLYLITVGTSWHVHWESPMTWVAVLILDVFAYLVLRNNWLR